MACLNTKAQESPGEDVQFIDESGFRGSSVKLNEKNDSFGVFVNESDATELVFDPRGCAYMPRTDSHLSSMQELDIDAFIMFPQLRLGHYFGEAKMLVFDHFGDLVGVISESNEGGAKCELLK